MKHKIIKFESTRVFNSSEGDPDFWEHVVTIGPGTKIPITQYEYEQLFSLLDGGEEAYLKFQVSS